MRLVSDEHAEGEVLRQFQSVELPEGRDPHAAARTPVRERGIPVLAVQPVCREPTVPRDLTQPIDQDRGRADDEEVPLPRGSEVGHRRDGLHRLAQTHLVAEQGMPLHESEFRPELLVATHRCGDQGQVQPEVADGRDDLLGQVAPLGVRLDAEPGDLRKPGVVVGGAGQEVRPGPLTVLLRRGRRRGLRAIGPLDLLLGSHDLGMPGPPPLRPSVDALTDSSRGSVGCADGDQQAGLGQRLVGELAEFLPGSLQIAAQPTQRPPDP